MNKEDFEDEAVELDEASPDEEELDVEDDDDVEDVVLEDDLELEDDAELAVEDDAAAVVDDAPVVVPVEAVPEAPTTARKATGEEEDEDVLDLDEELHPDDVEAPLDALLQERTASAKLEDEEEELEEEEPDTDERGDGQTKIVPRRPGEFLCSSCFLVLPRNQLADEERMLCRDCV
jgi:uncharacterized protein DUF4193